MESKRNKGKWAHVDLSKEMVIPGACFRGLNTVEMKEHFYSLAILSPAKEHPADCHSGGQ